MGDPVVGVLVVAAVIGVAAGISYLLRRNTTYHPPVDIAGLGLPPGLVVFTSTNCRRCKDALAAARHVGVPMREVTYELESDLQQRAGVSGVPLTVVVDPSGRAVAQLAGPVRLRKLQRAVARAGLSK